MGGGIQIPKHELRCKRCSKQIRMQRRPRQVGEPAKATWVEADMDGVIHNCARVGVSPTVAAVVYSKPGDRDRDQLAEFRPSKKDDRQRYGRPLSESDPDGNGTMKGRKNA